MNHQEKNVETPKLSKKPSIFPRASNGLPAVKFNGLLDGFVRNVPAVGAPLLRELFLTPQRKVPRRPASGAVLGSCMVGGQEVTIRGEGQGPAVALVHGWQGHMGQFTPLRQALLAAGFSVVSFDMPAHGESRGRQTNVSEFVEVLFEVDRIVGPLHGVIAHSLGGTALGLALSQRLPLSGAVMIAPMISFDFALDEFSKLLGLSPEARELAALATEKKVGLPRDAVDLMRCAPPEVPVKIFHDAEDARTLLRDSRKLARHWANAELTETEGLGHARILHDAQVISDVVRFFQKLPRAEVYRVESHLATVPLFAY